ENLDHSLLELAEMTKRISEIDLKFTDPKYIKTVFKIQDEVRKKYQSKKALDSRFKTMEWKGLKNNVIFLFIGLLGGTILTYSLSLLFQ
ncbi:MAG: hypothetical protein HeimC3_31700, partial [Candidatus Heimdallarchaeota archaeon LC_3]